MRSAAFSMCVTSRNAQRPRPPQLFTVRTEEPGQRRISTTSPSRIGMVATHARAVEAGRGTPDPGAGEARREVVVDPVSDVLDRGARVERERFRVRLPHRSEAKVRCGIGISISR
jgi:transcription initiation factor TFIID subunit TAF12